MISTSFADIFKQNSMKNGLLPVVVAREVHAWLFANPEATIGVDLAAQELTLPDGRAVGFPVDAFSRHCLLEGIDELGYILQQDAAIRAYEAGRVGSVDTLRAG